MSRQELGNKIWHACDIMRGDDGTSGILEYTEQLSWMIFLRVFEEIEEEERFRAHKCKEEHDYAIDPEYHWSHWSKLGDSRHIADFINQDLFPYLKQLPDTTPSRRKIRSIFEQIPGNRMEDPDNLKRVIDLIDELFDDFKEQRNSEMESVVTSLRMGSEDSHVLSILYEELLLRLGQEGGVAGEFYTPRPVVRAIVEIVNPQSGERLLDPFCGSGGFLAESYHYIRKHRGLEITPEEERILQTQSFFGQEKKSLPYLIGIMNVILHGIGNPNIVRMNTLGSVTDHFQEIQNGFDVILTNPPFGGKEAPQIQKNFPIQAAATELLALQYVMKRLKKDGGRCGIVLPEGVLFRTDRSYMLVKKALIEEYNLQAVVSLPIGIFAGVSSSGSGPKTNFLFFTSPGPTSEVWMYDLHIPEGATYSKQKTICDEDLEDLLRKWRKKEESDNSWRVLVGDIIEKGYDLRVSLYDPNPRPWTGEQPLEALLDRFVATEELIENVLASLLELMQTDARTGHGIAKNTPLGRILQRRKEKANPSDHPKQHFSYVGLENIEAGTSRLVGFKPSLGEEIKSSKSVFRKGDILYGKLRPYLNKVWIADFDGIASTDIWVFQPPADADPKYVFYSLRSPRVVEASTRLMTGAHLPRISQKDFDSIEIPLPQLVTQQGVGAILDQIFEHLERVASLRNEQPTIDALSRSFLEKLFGR